MARVIKSLKTGKTSTVSTEALAKQPKDSQRGYFVLKSCCEP
jgi:hypothetical protein